MHLKTCLRTAALLAVLPLSLSAQQRRVMAPPAGDLSALDDEFDSPASLAAWTSHAAAEGWPEMAKTVDVSTTVPGSLYLEPHTSGWYADFRAPFLFREVSGDFDVTARVRAAGRAAPCPPSPGRWPG